MMTSSSAEILGEEEEEVMVVGRRFGDLRSVQWRIDLGILPSPSSSSSSSSIANTVDIRRLTANSRRRYVALRRHLLIEPLISTPPPSHHHIMDNPLSLNPDSMWGRFFRNEELERMLDQDLSRLYPEHGSYFQTPECQAMLRRILLLWCLRNPDYGYRQGMHELLAPLLYVLHVDLDHLSEVRKTYEDHFTDKFDGFAFHENDLTYRFDFKKFSDCLEDEIRSPNSPVSNVCELDPKVKDIIALTDAYGAEGELGIVMSMKFMEHDAYCMFEALMNGVGGAVAMVEFFSHSPLVGPRADIPPVIEASSAIYHLLSIVDSPLHSHLVELGVEPQYFALRWLRVLFGREFALENLLIVWDEIFAFDNKKLHEFAEIDVGYSFGILNSSRGAFIVALAVSMILHMRSSLFAAENATSCLQRLLNFPDDTTVEKLLTKGKSLQGLAVDVCKSTSIPMYIGAYKPSNSAIVRGHSRSSDSVPPIATMSFVPESYWEKKWRVLHKEAETKPESLEKKVPSRVSSWSEKVKLRLSRTESEASALKVDNGKRSTRPSVRRSLLKDLARQLGSEEDADGVVSGEDLHAKEAVEEPEQDLNIDSFSFSSDDGCKNGTSGTEEESVSSDPPSPVGGGNEHGNELCTSVASNLSVVENDVDQSNANCSTSDQEPLGISTLEPPPEEVHLESVQNVDSTGKSTISNERKIIPGKFLWFWNFGRNAGDGTTSAKSCSSDTAKALNIHRNELGSSTVGSFDNSSVISKGEDVDENVMVTCRNIGQSMIEHIQVIESVFQQDWGQAGASENFTKNGFMGRGQETAVAALKELRKISNILCEM